jgi:hypothetical protein
MSERGSDTIRLVRACAVLALTLLLLSTQAFAGVTRIAITSRTPLPAGYEKVVGRIFFEVDPRDPHNARVADIGTAEVNAAGKLEFSSSFYALVPSGGGNHVALVDIVNRGRATVSGMLNVIKAGANPDIGDEFLARAGYTVIGIGWEFDVPDDRYAIQVPVALGGRKLITGIAHGVLTPDASDTRYVFSDLDGYKPGDPEGAETRLTWREHVWDAPTEVPRSQWRLSGNSVTASPALVPGRIYELSYRTESAPLAGLGFLAVRDTVSWMKYATDTPFHVQLAYAVGVSQSGRFLRSFLYEGFNIDDRGRQVIDAMMIHIAGASRLDLNRRFATPASLAMYDATAYPFTDRAERDPVTGMSEGLLDNPRARAAQPKIVYTNTGVEYWGGGRTAALTHTSPDGTRDLALAPNVRSYFLTGAQHTPGAFPPVADRAAQKNNPLNYRWILRALLVDLDRWVRDGVAPPDSVVPQLKDGTLVRASQVKFPGIPGVQSPRALTAGKRAGNALLKTDGKGADLPLLVPQVDADGNEIAGVRLPDLTVPLATYTGWNFRKAIDGAADQLVPLLGSFLPFPSTSEAGRRARDPRRAVSERYAHRAAYLEAVRAAAQKLVSQRLLLMADTDAIVARAGQTWDLIAATTSTH